LKKQTIDRKLNCFAIDKKKEQQEEGQHQSNKDGDGDDDDDCSMY